MKPPEALRPWAHELHLETSWPQIAVDQYIDVFTRLGMSPIEARAFDPFFHEIVAVEQTPPYPPCSQSVRCGS